MPINPATNQSKGFAFVEYDNKNTALKAISVNIEIFSEFLRFLKELNGTQFRGRTIAVDLSVEKRRFEAQKQSMNIEQSKNMAGNRNKSFENGDDELENAEEKSDNEMEEEEESEIEDDEDEEVDDGDADEEENGTEEEEEEQKEDFSSTIFVRNISYDVGQSEFRDFFKKFGRLEYAKVK